MVKGLQGKLYEEQGGPGVGLDHPDGSLPIQHVLLFYLRIFSV